MNTKLQNILLPDFFEEFFGIKQNALSKVNNVKNYNVIENEDGSNTIFINALGYSKKDINIEVVNGNLLITAVKPDDSTLFLPTIDYNFKLGYTFSDEGITAAMDNGILSVTVLSIKKVEPTKKIVSIN